MAQNGVPQSVEYRGINTAEILNELFKDFYYELLKCKEKALRSHQMAEELEQKAKTIPEGQTNRGEEAANENLHPLTAHRHESVPIHEAKAMQEIQRYLLQVLTEKIQPFLHMLDAQSLLLLKEAQYAMIALADEVFLTLPWKGSHAWRFELLESQFFQTQSSGEQIFKKIDELLSHYDLSKEPLASIYFHILALGFRGQFQERESTDILKNYERKLYAFIHGRNPSMEEYGLTKLIPECYERTLLSEMSIHLPDVRFWMRLLLWVCVAFLFVSYIIWYDAASGIFRALGEIFDQFYHFLDLKGP